MPLTPWMVSQHLGQITRKDNFTWRMGGLTYLSKLWPQLEGVPTLPALAKWQWGPEKASHQTTQECRCGKG